MDGTRVALVTGTSKGIGKALAQHFLAHGYAVHGCSRQAAGWSADRYEHHVADVADEEAVKAMLTAIRERHGRLDVVVNNAGLASMNAALLTPASTVDRLMAVNFRGTFVVCRESAKMMMKQGTGRIVNISSVAVPLRLEGEAVYAASKSAVETLTRVLAYELGGFGITCNAIAPAPIETDLIAGVPDDKIQRIVNRLAVKRLGRMEDVTNVIDFLVRPESGYVTGQVICLGGV